MPKKSAKKSRKKTGEKIKKEAKKKKVTKAPEEKETKKDKLISILVDNSIAMQKAFTNLSEKMNKVTTQIADLLQLFEVTAHSIAEKPELGFEREFSDKINVLLDQNKIIARGISLMSQHAMALPQAAPAPRPTAPAVPRPSTRPAPPARPAAPAARAPAPKAPAPAPAQPPAETTAMPGPSEGFSASEYEAKGEAGRPGQSEAGKTPVGKPTPAVPTAPPKPGPAPGEAPAKEGEAKKPKPLPSQ
jgi:hypothetical protein